MNASLPFGPTINTDIDYYQALFLFFCFVFVFVFGLLSDVSDAWFVREEKPVMLLMKKI